MPWYKSTQEIIALLVIRNARAAAAGRPCPIAAKVLERLEAANGNH